MKFPVYQVISDLFLIGMFETSTKRFENKLVSIKIIKKVQSGGKRLKNERNPVRT